MSVLRNITIAVFVISLITFVALFGQLPALRKTPIGWLQRVLCIRIPNRLKRIDTSLTGGQIALRCQTFGRYLFYEKNPVVLILFLLLLTGSASIFLWQAVHRLPTSLLIPIPLILAPPYVFTYLCVTYKAHYITPVNLESRKKDYPYDHIIFRPRTHCKTCQQIKPARSKHCSLCGFCVANCDHHCPWINNCVGRGNYRYFLALLLTLSMVQAYGAYLSWWVLSPYLQLSSKTSLFSLGRLDDIGQALVVAVNRGGISIAGVGLLAGTTAFLPFGLLVYHCYLIWAGMTTNESQKWSDWRDDMADGYVFKANRPQLHVHINARQASIPDDQHNPAFDMFVEDEIDVKWPIRNDQVVVTTKDGKPPQGQEAIWHRVWSLKEIENIYDLGGLENLLCVLRGE